MLRVYRLQMRCAKIQCCRRSQARVRLPQWVLRAPLQVLSRGLPDPPVLGRQVSVSQRAIRTGLRRYAIEIACKSKSFSVCQRLIDASNQYQHCILYSKIPGAEGLARLRLFFLRGAVHLQDEGSPGWGWGVGVPAQLSWLLCLWHRYVCGQPLPMGWEAAYAGTKNLADV